MNNDPIFICKPPAVPVCDALGCYCEARPVPIGKPPNACKAPQRMVCQPGIECYCALPPGQQLSGPPELVDDGCALIVSIVVAGIKKSLIGCWVDG